MVEEEDSDPLLLEYWDRIVSYLKKKRLPVDATMIRQFFGPLLSSGSDSKADRYRCTGEIPGRFMQTDYKMLHVNTCSKGDEEI